MENLRPNSNREGVDAPGATGIASMFLPISRKKEVISLNNKLFVGIDVSKCTNSVVLMDNSGNTVDSFDVDNNLPGANTLSSKVTAAMQALSCDSVNIGLEATSVYGDHIVSFIKRDNRINNYDYNLHVLNPKQVKRFKGIYSDIPKNDRIDAWVIADNLRFGRITKEVYMDDNVKALQKLTRARFFAANNLAREKNRFLNHLFLKFSSLTQEKVFSNTFGKASTAVITDFLSVDEIAAMDIEDLVNIICEKGKNRFSDPDKVAKAVQKAARSSYRLSKTVNDSVNQVLTISMISIKAYNDQLKAFNKAIEQQASIFPNTLQSIPGLGPVYSAGIIAEIGNIHRFKDHAALAKYAGLTWTEHQSGSFTAENTRMIKSGNKYLKYYLVQATNLARMHAPEYRCFYQLKYKKSQHHKHKRALALTARKFVRLVYALLRDNRLYISPEE